MGKKSKVGKQRKDRYYHLAKETGYRSRSAFKLIQLNRKFQFLQKSRVLVDLCAAPGGWLQVAAKHMPISSQIIGVDLFPIKAIPNVVTFTADITTEKCRQLLKKELKTWKADCIIHDGAPNVGKNWLHDAFSQAQLTLSSLKLSVEFLNKGGWFVTKVFRSKDYQALLWVLYQLFRKVHATKPQASRNESAEIFVVCQGFTAPDKIDQKFFDPKYIFKDVNPDPKKKLTILMDPAKLKKAKAVGYADGDYTQHKAVMISDFLSTNEPIEMLNDCNELVFDSDQLLKHRLTTEEIMQCCRDICVLGRREVRELLQWRSKLRKLLAKCEDTQERSKKEDGDSEQEDKDDGSSDEEAQINEELVKLKAAEKAEAKRKRKDTIKKRRKLREKLQKLGNVGDHLEADDVSLFSLKKIHSKKQLEEIDRGDLDTVEVDEDEDLAEVIELSEDEEDIDSGLDSDEADLLRQEKSIEEVVVEEDQSDYEMEDGEAANPLMVDLEQEDKSSRLERQTNLWFDKEIFSGLENDEDEDYEISQMTEHYKKEGGSILERKKRQSKKHKITKDEESYSSEEEQEDDSDGEDDKIQKKNGPVISGEISGDSDSDYDDEVLVNSKEEKSTKKAKKRKSFEVVPAEGPVPRQLDPQSLALGTLMATSKKKKREIIEGGFHRYTFNDEGLPEWFVEDEAKHYKKHLPVTKELVEEYKARLKEINARPIKKVAEAKARKKKKAMMKMEKLKKKAEAITDTVDTSAKEKMNQIKSLYKKAGMGKKKKTEVKYVRARKSLAGKKAVRPKGIKGPYKMVDPRMKKEVRAKQRSEQRKKKGGGRKR
ncbi:pre-rRNA 2'-O-ribose RNA methyltransferase FTSJ3-like [Anneissia japonica]|uniref:pre-rRNA 2'-O-ribose RNA methyltransferase FTSJ3-like n=1 Tax=Anneissia japonica TaxID=1529436 RepID=UPI0014258716|nr:pre-rRNA 2'-O-ribose RNA methyltransferase FTSJ3-like [Anneissia japonica]